MNFTLIEKNLRKLIRSVHIIESEKKELTPASVHARIPGNIEMHDKLLTDIVYNEAFRLGFAVTTDPFIIHNDEGQGAGFTSIKFEVLTLDQVPKYIKSLKDGKEKIHD
jgi:hypothetical protein